MQPVLIPVELLWLNSRSEHQLGECSKGLAATRGGAAFGEFAAMRGRKKPSYQSALRLCNLQGVFDDDGSTTANIFLASRASARDSGVCSCREPESVDVSPAFGHEQPKHPATATRRVDPQAKAFDASNKMKSGLLQPFDGQRTHFIGNFGHGNLHQPIHQKNRIEGDSLPTA